jgi:NAD(P)-dependent dehydrogenase (short-subunit alcohol dehydrogenase family)
LDRSDSTMEEIKSKCPSSEIASMQLDLGSLESIRHFAKDFLLKYHHINILVNNAGVYCPLKKRMKTQEGYEFNFGVNHLGHFLLTNLLLDGLRRGAPSRLALFRFVTFTLYLGIQQLKQLFQGCGRGFHPFRKRKH